MFEILQFEFMRNALLTGFLVSVICGIIGTFVVVNRIAFLAGGIAHAAYGGIGLAFFLGLPYLTGTLSFTLFAAFIMAAVTLKAGARTDTFIGVLWATGMALGVLLLDLTPGYNVDLMSYLFGSILAVPKSDLWQMFILCLMVVCIVMLFYHNFLALSYDKEFAQLRGLPVKSLYFLLIGMIAISIVMIIRVVGLILVIALLTIPPYIAEKYSSSLRMMMLISVLLCCTFTMVGLWLSYIFNLTSGATIIMIASAAFFINFLVQHLKTKSLYSKAMGG
jgi:zinc transport system permease protein